MRRRHQQEEQRFRLMWRMGVKKACDESSDTAQKHGNASNSQFGAVHGRRRQIHETGLYAACDLFQRTRKTLGNKKSSKIVCPSRPI